MTVRGLNSVSVTHSFTCVATREAGLPLYEHAPQAQRFGAVSKVTPYLKDWDRGQGTEPVFPERILGSRAQRNGQGQRKTKDGKTET